MNNEYYLNMDTNWVIVHALTFPSQAYMVQGYLESEGIETMLKDELTTQVHNFYSNALGGVKVLVKEEDLELAQAVLKQGGYLNLEEPEKIVLLTKNAETNKILCPFCHSDNIGKRKEPDVIMLVISLLVGLIVPVLRRSDMCFDCGKEWKYK